MRIRGHPGCGTGGIAGCGEGGYVGVGADISWGIIVCGR